MCVCVIEREKDTMYTENKKIVLQEAEMNQQLTQREREGAYVVTFSLRFVTTTEYVS